MPIIKSAIKRNKQNTVRRARNKHFRSLMKTMIKKVLNTAEKDKKKASEFLPLAYSSIDTAAKKNIIHKKNASRKKSRLAKAVA